MDPAASSAAVSVSPSALAWRDNAAIAQVASLLPANAEEAVLAAQFVAASAYALDCLRLAREHAANLPVVLQCTAQSASMMRPARSARSLLLRVQAVRQRREGGRRLRPPRRGRPVRGHLPAPRRAALIRSLGGLPARCDFGPPPPELVAAIVTGTSPTLRALDAPMAA